MIRTVLPVCLLIALVATSAPAAPKTKTKAAPKAKAKEEGAEVPDPYRGLLVHKQDMTSTLEAYVGQGLSLEVLQSRTEDDCAETDQHPGDAQRVHGSPAPTQSHPTQTRQRHG